VANRSSMINPMTLNTGSRATPATSILVSSLAKSTWAYCVSCKANKHSIANPIEFTWRELMDTIGNSTRRRLFEQLKLAIRSIEGTRIRSKFALKNAEGHMKSPRTRLRTLPRIRVLRRGHADNETVAQVRTRSGCPNGTSRT